MYHDVFEQNPNESGFLQKRDLPYKINAVVFENHVKAISDYCIERDLPKESVVFTFDDGGKSFYHVIAPILEKYGYVGVFFISTNYIGTDTFLTEDCKLDYKTYMKCKNYKTNGWGGLDQ